VLDTRQDLR
jgi:CHC2 zinc finger